MFVTTLSLLTIAVQTSMNARHTHASMEDVLIWQTHTNVFAKKGIQATIATQTLTIAHQIHVKTKANAQIYWVDIHALVLLVLKAVLAKQVWVKYLNVALNIKFNIYRC